MTTMSELDYPQIGEDVWKSAFQRPHTGVGALVRVEQVKPIAEMLRGMRRARVVGIVAYVDNPIVPPVDQPAIGKRIEFEWREPLVGIEEVAHG